MIKVEKIWTGNFENAIRGMRNPMNSWEKSDSTCAFHMVENFAPDDPMRHKYYKWNDEFGFNVKLGASDLSLMKKLYSAGTEHRKFMRQIFASMDITAPLYWWKEFDTYKVGTCANSCSTMHKIHAKEFTIDDFSYDHLDEFGMAMLGSIINYLNENRRHYILSENKEDWWQLIQILPSSYNQKRTVTMNYENAASIINQRKNHKLDEWRDLCDILLDELPYLREIMVKAFCVTT